MWVCKLVREGCKNTAKGKMDPDCCLYDTRSILLKKTGQNLKIVYTYLSCQCCSFFIAYMLYRRGMSIHWRPHITRLRVSYHNDPIKAKVMKKKKWPLSLFVVMICSPQLFVRRFESLKKNSQVVIKLIRA